MSPAVLSAMIKDLRSQAQDDIHQVLHVPVLNKEVAFALRNIMFREITINKGRLTLREGYGDVNITGIEAVVDCEV